MDDGDDIGGRVRRYRRLRGLSLEEAAGLAGISKGYLSRLERGERSADSRSLLNNIAGALEVSLADLTGQPYLPRDPDHAAARRGLAAIRLALLDPAHVEWAGDVDLRAAVLGLQRLRQASDLVGQAGALPGLLHRTQQAAADSDRPDDHELAVLALYGASSLSRQLGELDLSILAAERALRAAQATDAPVWVAFAAQTQSRALCAVGAPRQAMSLALAGAGEMAGSGSTEQVAARGSCLLASAFATACLGDHDGAREQLDEARQAARALPAGVRSVVAEFTYFADWNVEMHRVAVEVEAGAPAAALAAARSVDCASVPSRSRLSYFWADVARAYARLDRPTEAVSAFRKAEQAAPLRTRLSPVVRDGVRDLLDTARRRSTSAELCGLAQRCGVMAS